MPGGNGTGPQGMGPMTGRGAGFCAGNSITGYINPTAGRRLGMGAGRGLGMGAGRGVARGGRCFGGIRPRGNSLAYQDSDSLKNYAKHLELELESAKKRLEEIEVAGKQ